MTSFINLGINLAVEKDVVTIQYKATPPNNTEIIFVLIKHKTKTKYFF